MDKKPEYIDRKMLLKFLAVVGCPLTKTEEMIIKGVPKMDDDEETYLAKLELLYMKMVPKRRRNLEEAITSMKTETRVRRAIDEYR